MHRNRDTVTVEVGGFSIEGPARAGRTLQALCNGSAEPFMAELFERALSPGMVVLDVGAFLGRYSLIAARRVGPTGRVYAFEPDPRNLPFLAKNIAMNGMSDCVTAFPYAVADRSGTQALFLDPEEGSGSSLFFRRRPRAAATPVQCVALDEFLEESVAVDVIKLDVEGGEFWALRGMERTIERGSPRMAIFLECFPRGLRSAGASTWALLQWLERFGFSVLVIDERRRRLFPIKPTNQQLWRLYFNLLLPLGFWVNLMCVRRDGKSR